MVDALPRLGRVLSEVLETSLVRGSQANVTAVEVGDRTRSSSNAGWGGQASAADVLQVFAWPKSDRSARWDADLFSGAWVSSDAPLSGFYLKNTKASKFYSFAALHRHTHRIENRIDRHLRLDLGDPRGFRNLVHDVDFDHDLWAKKNCKYHRYYTLQVSRPTLTSPGALGLI